MPFDDFTEITKSQEAKARVELIHAFNHSSAGLATGRMEVTFVGEASRTETAEAKRKRAAARLLREIQEIIRAGEMASFVADHVFDAKSDSQIADIVAQIETKTGLTLANYAAGIIGVKAVERRPGETDAQYRRRILGALGEEIIDPRTGRIKPEYADDPLAQIIAADDAYQSIMADVARINRGDVDAKALVTKFADAGYEPAKHAAMNVEGEGAAAELRNGQDESRGDEANADDEFAESQTFFSKPLTR